jgi:hypothetical protein
MTMRGRMLSAAALALAGSVAIVAAQEHSDPRVGLKAGLRDAGQAARHMELVASLPKPEGFYDPKQPAGEPTAPERPAGADTTVTGPASPTGSRSSGLNFANSDMAFSGTLMFLGNFNGFNTFEIEDPRKPRLLASVVCPGGQGDVSVHGNLLFMSVEQTRGRVDCGTQGVETTASPERFRGIRIFDITDLKKPKQVAAVQTCRGSHTHTLVVDPDDKENVYIYGSGTSTVRPAEELAGCSGAAPTEDPNTSLFSIDVIQVPLAAPEKARIVNRPRIFADPQTGAIAGLARESKQAPGVQSTRETNQCHDITVFPQIGLAAGACAGNGILLDISDPVHPVRLDAAADKNFAYWHSATFNNDGTKVIFTDEWGGGTRPRCRATDPKNWGADAVFEIVDRKLRFESYYKMPAAQTEQENCVAHNGSLIPVPGRDIMAQAWYQGGVSVFDFTDSGNPVEIAFFDRGPIDAHNLMTGGFWSAYWYNGYLYASEIARGVDVFRLTPSEFLTKNEIDAAAVVRLTDFNPQHQSRITWPSSLVVARAYLDQLNRGKAISPARASAIKSAIDNADKKSPSKGAIDQLSGAASQLESDIASVHGRDAERLKAMIEILKKP